MKKARLLVCLMVAIALVLVATLPAFAASPLSGVTKPTTFNVPKGLEMDWTVRHHYNDYQTLFTKLNTTYPNLAEMYSIGHSYMERDLWCLEITNENKSNDKKTGIGVFANIHGGEQESGECALYTAWWLLLNSDSKYVKSMLDNYIIYVIPIINPDGYEQSFVYNNRPNLRPTDRDGDGAPFSDPYTDINGDGFISNVYIGTASQTDYKQMTSLGMESANWNHNAKLGDDPRSSTIDLNRTFDYMWNLYNVESYNTKGAKVIGANAWKAAGPAAASEPEVQAVQNFLAQKPMAALVTMHTGIQCVLWPWCYTAPDYSKPGFSFMKEVGTKMAKTFAATTGRDFYAKASWEDYPTAAELIDYSWGRLGIHSYTMEVYYGGMSDTSPGALDEERCAWNNKLPETTMKFYSYDQVSSVLKLSPKELGLQANQGLWFRTTSTAQMSGKAPVDQDKMVSGAKDAILVMIESETSNDNYHVPTYLTWK